VGKDSEKAGVVWCQRVSIFSAGWDGSNLGALNTLELWASLTPAGPGRGAGYPFPWTVQQVIEIPLGGAVLAVPPDTAKTLTISHAKTNVTGEWIDRDGVTVIGDFLHNGTAAENAAAMLVPERAGHLSLTGAGPAGNAVLSWGQASG
jgi:hypothetical protein